MDTCYSLWKDTSIPLLHWLIAPMGRGSSLTVSIISPLYGVEKTATGWLWRITTDSTWEWKWCAERGVYPWWRVRDHGQWCITSLFLERLWSAFISRQPIDAQLDSRGMPEIFAHRDLPVTMSILFAYIHVGRIAGIFTDRVHKFRAAVAWPGKERNRSDNQPPLHM